jgi:LysM repeat protein
MAPRALRRTGQILTGLTALLSLLALLFGAPIALALLGGNPLPDQLPTWTQITNTLMRPDDGGTLFVATLTIIGWIAWAAFAVPIIVESVARLRGVRTPRIPGLGAPQRVAAGMIAAIGLMIASPAVAATASSPAYAAPPPAAAVTAPAQHAVGTPTAQQTETTGAAVARQANTADEPATYEVHRGDYLSAISKRVLGDADRYPEIAALNAGHISDPDLIRPGWELKLPSDATDRGARAHAAGQVEEAEAAAPATGDQAEKPAPAPSDAGDQAASPAPTAPAAEATTPPAAAPTAGPTADAAAPTATATTAAPTTTAAQPTAPTPAQTGASDADEQDDNLTVPITATVAAMSVLAALTLFALRRRRARQQQHRRPRRRIAQPVDGTTEAKLRVAAAPTDLDRLDTGLRLLATGLADWPDEQWPDVVAAWMEHGAVHLVLTKACAVAPPAPWLSDGETLWTLPAHVPLPEVTEQLAPLPTLVALGSQPEQHLLVDLERLGMLTLTGDRSRTLDLLRYIAGELAHNHWSDDVHVTLAGFDPAEAQLLAQLNPHRVTIASSTEAAVAKLRRQLDDTRTALDAAGTASTVQGRATDSGDAWPPQVLLIADPAGELEQNLAELEELLVAAPSTGFAAVVTGAEQPHGRWPITVTGDGQLHVSFLTDSPLTASALPASMLQPLVDLLQAADITDDEPTPPAPDTEDWAAGTDAAGGLQDMLDIDEADDADGADQADDQGEPGAAEAASALKPPVRITTRGASTATSWSPTTAPLLLTLPAAAADPEAVEQRRRDREHRDPHLDADLAAWIGSDPARPRIGILGLVEIAAPGVVPKNRHRFYGEIVVYLAARGARGATAAQLEDAIWREQEATSSTRRSAISRARTWLGDTPDGGKWMPQMGADQLYRIADGYLFDWTLFRRLRARGEARADAGVSDLRQALELVRGAPFDGVQDAYTADRTAYAWLPDSEIAPTHLVAAIVDTAHQLVELSLAAGDLPGARWALERAWLADPDRYEDQPWRDAMRIAHADGRDSELKALIQDLLRHRDAEVAEDLDPETFRLVQRLTSYPSTVAS